MNAFEGAYRARQRGNRAAERCHVSQPTLSIALQNLEAELGVSLVERHKGHVSLTALGYQVVAQARKALDETRRVELVAQLGLNPLKGEFRLGVIHTIGPYLLPGLITSLAHIAPELHLYIEESMTALLADYLKYGTIDAAIITLPFDVPGIAVRALYDEFFQVVVPRSHPWENRASIPSCEVRGEDVLVLKAGNCFREQVLDACPDISHAEGAMRQGHSIEAIRCMVASGFGVSVLPESALSGPYCSAMVRAIPFEKPVPSRRVALAWRRGFTRGEVIEALIDAVKGMNNPIYRLIEP
ncbi:MAG: hydrogen peroxide-inducible genes activator [Sulfurimicrobium sp.]